MDKDRVQSTTFVIVANFEQSKALSTIDEPFFYDVDHPVSLSTLCGQSTIVVPYIAPEQSMIYYDNLPILTIPKFTTYSEDCSITNYQLLDSEGAIHPAFNQNYMQDSSSNQLGFSLNSLPQAERATYYYHQRESMSYYYFIQVEINSGELYWESKAYQKNTFKIAPGSPKFDEFADEMITLLEKTKKEKENQIIANLREE